jgi:hypothetical protein
MNQWLPLGFGSDESQAGLQAPHLTLLVSGPSRSIIQRHNIKSLKTQERVDYGR